MNAYFVMLKYYILPSSDLRTNNDSSMNEFNITYVTNYNRALEKVA